MSRFGVDWAWGSPSIAALKRAGVTFACRYYSRDASKNLCGVSPIPTKPPTKPNEARLLQAANIDVVGVWETTAGRALQGFAAGVSDADEANRQANACGAPPDSVIYFAVDIDATESDQRLLNNYFRGVQSVLGPSRVGAYGGYYVIKRLFDEKLIKYGWQTYAWSGGQWDKRAQLQQYSNGHEIDGVSCDYNRAVALDFGQWGPKLPPSDKRDKKPKQWWVWLNQFIKRGHWTHPK